MQFNLMDEAWRVAFAFDPQRQAVLLVGGDNGSANQKRFYKRLIDLADNRYSEHLPTLVDSAVKEPSNGKKTSWHPGKHARRASRRGCPGFCVNGG